jgi:hypothetical protein
MHDGRIGAATILTRGGRVASWNQALHYRERELFEAILSLAPEQRKLVRELVTALVKYPPREKGKSGSL